MKKFLVIIMFALSFATPAFAQSDEDPDRDRRQLITQFVDAYRQAYEKRNIRFIKYVFSEDALIITQTLELTKGFGTISYGGKGKKYRLIVESKKQYVARLDKIFSSSTVLRLNVSGLTIVRHRVHDTIYGVTFRQLWQGDGEGAFKDERNKEGFIFLMIDFSNSELTPTIQIRTWQPEKAAEEEGVFGIYDFEII